MEKEKNSGLLNDCRTVDGYNPYEKAVWLDCDDGQKPYLCVNERIEWYTRYCESFGLCAGITTEFVPELTKQGMITMKTTIILGNDTYTGYGSKLVDAAEGYSGDDIECAETRAVGRALRNAGFGSPFDDNEDNPVDGFKPQPVPQTMPVSMTPEQVFAQVTEETSEPENKKSTSTVSKSAPTTKPSDEMKTDRQLAEALKKPYPFKPWPKLPLYELLEQPDLKKNLTWIANEYKGNAEVSNWAKGCLKYIYATNDTDKAVYLAARKILKDNKFIK